MAKLYICEKPSLAAALAENLGTPKKFNNYYEVNGDYVAALRGHIMELYNPAQYDESYQKWSYDNLPIIPPKFQKGVKNFSNYQAIYDGIKSLMEKSTEVINVGDPDREGQLLVDEVLEAMECKLPIKRLFINAMDNTTISRALNNIEDNNIPKNKNLSLAALGREQTDWLIGINASRKFTLDSGQTLKIGRVKIPMLALVARRNEQIDNFTSMKHYGVVAYFRLENSLPFPATWQPAKDLLDEDNRLLNILDARACRQKVEKKQGIIKSIIVKQGSEAAPLPYSLSTLQRAAGPKLGFSPSKTLEIAQELYEKKKVITYPRSDSNYLPESQFADAATIIDNLKLIGDNNIKEIADNANKDIKSSCYNTEKVEAHHALIPTLEKIDLSELTSDQQGLYLLIAKRFLQQFYPPQTFEATTFTIECEGETFLAKGKRIINEGWKITINATDEADKDNESEEIKTLPKAQEGDKLIISSLEIPEKETTPPKRFTQDTLIGALTSAHKYVKDPGLREIVKNVKGLGTEATRSTIIEDLIKSGQFIEKANKKRKELFVSDSVKELLKFLPDDLTYPDKTALMELDLDKIAKGEMTLNAYMNGQIQYVRDLMTVKSAFTPVERTDNNDRPICPICKIGKLYQHEGKFGKYWNCSNYKNGCKAVFSDYNDKPAIHKCPACDNGYLKQIKTKNNEILWCCSEIDNGCKTFFKDNKGKPVIHKCPVCSKGYLKEVKLKDQDPFWSCSEYKNGCKASFTSNKGQPVIKKCPKCKKGYIKRWHGQKGDYYSCGECKAYYNVDKSGLPLFEKK